MYFVLSFYSSVSCLLVNHFRCLSLGDVFSAHGASAPTTYFRRAIRSESDLFFTFSIPIVFLHRRLTGSLSSPSGLILMKWNCKSVAPFQDRKWSGDLNSGYHLVRGRQIAVEKCTMLANRGGSLYVGVGKATILLQEGLVQVVGWNCGGWESLFEALGNTSSFFE